MGSLKTDGFAHKIGVVVHRDGLRLHRDRRRSCTTPLPVVPAQRDIGEQTRALNGELVHYGQHADPRPGDQALGNKIHTPLLVGSGG